MKLDRPALLRSLPYALTCLFVAFCLFSAYDAETGLTRLIHFGSEFHEQAIPQVRDGSVTIYDNSGYDGQFYAQMATDPLLRNLDTVRALDDSAYRARRGLLPAVCYVLAVGNATAALHVYSVINVLCWVGLGILVFHWLDGAGIRVFLRWLGCVLSLGAVSSVVLALLDLPAMLFALLGVYAYERNRTTLSTLAFALTGLTKDSFILAACSVFEVKKTYQGLAMMAAAALPLALWIVYLWFISLKPSDGAGNFAPLSGLFFEFKTTLAYLQEGKIHNVLALTALVYQAGYLALHRDWQAALWRLFLPFAGLMLILGPAVWDGDPGAAYRVLLPIAIVFNLRLRDSRLFYLHWILGNLSLIVAVKYLLKLL